MELKGTSALSFPFWKVNRTLWMSLFVKLVKLISKWIAWLCVVLHCFPLLYYTIIFFDFTYVHCAWQAKMKFKKKTFFYLDRKKTLLFKKVLRLNVSARTCNSLQNNGRIHQSEGLERDDFYTMFKVPPCHCFNFLLLFQPTQKTHLRIWFLFIQKK